MKKILREIKYYLWALNGFLGLRLRSNTPQKATILFTYFNPVRMKHINHQLRNIFKCDFVGQVIISNHNPEIDINSLIKVRDPRIQVVNQNVRRGCGHRWLVANEFSPEYLIVVDDDVLIFPWQLRQLFEALVAEPAIPHGFAGMVQRENDVFEYFERNERYVDYIGEVYAITGKQLSRYVKLRDDLLADNGTLRKSVEYFADFVIVSETGNHRPRIHDVGRLFRCPTYDKVGVAVHKEVEFYEGLISVARALKQRHYINNADEYADFVCSGKQ